MLVWSVVVCEDCGEFWEEVDVYGVRYGWVLMIYGWGGISGVLLLVCFGFVFIVDELNVCEM